MKTILILIQAGLLATFGLTACHTAHHAAHESVDIADHAVQKTGHAVHHGAQKVEKHL